MSSREMGGEPGAGPRRWLSRLRRSTAVQPPSPDDPTLVVVASAADDVASSSSVLDASSWDPADHALVRHRLVLPTAQVDAAVQIAALDDYEPFPVTESTGSAGSARSVADGSVEVVLQRVQMVDAVKLSQERSRMASLGSRHGGTVIGWEILQRRTGGGATARPHA